MSVKTRLLLMAGVAIAFSVLIVGFAIVQMERLADLQNDGYSKTQTQAAAGEASQLGSQFYQVIADAIINRNLDESKKQFAELLGEARGDLAKLAKDADTAEERQAVANAQESVVKLVELFEKKLLPMLSEKNKVDAEISSLDGEIDKNVQGIRVELQKVAKSMNAEAELADREFDAIGKTAIRTVLLVAVLSAIALGIFSFITIRAIILPLNEAQRVTASIAAGDLSQAVQLNNRSDEFGQMLNSCEKMRSSLREIAQALQDGANDIASTSTQLAATTTQIAKSTETQSQEASSMAASVEELSVSITHMSDRAEDVRGAATDSGKIAEQGVQAVTRMMDENDRTAHNIEDAATQIRNLGALSDRISTIVKVIREVAEQTNLLALNAAIEAARAGEQGRGFAVVADEVRKLAERTGKSTSDITAVIDDVQRATLAAVETMEKAVTAERNSMDLSHDVSDSITKIRDESSRVVSAVADITGALREQGTASTDIARRVEMVSQMGEENCAAVEETAVAASSLENLAARLKIAAGRFRL
ncbi:MAG TPA: methyl-accepting chemotaxis protein [Azonexus sp.]|nr:methyl-accepting chemotaxis protein [Azonexus sp.]